MGQRRGKNIGLVAILVALIVVLSVGTASAKKNTVTATLNGKRFKWKGRYVLISHGPSGVITVATKPARPGSILRTIGFGCPVLLTNATFPLTPDPAYCNANYTETKVGRRTTIKGWLALGNVQVTYQSFEGGRLIGTFAAVLGPLLGNASPPVTVQGEFNGTATADQ